MLHRNLNNPDTQPSATKPKTTSAKLITEEPIADVDDTDSIEE